MSYLDAQDWLTKARQDGERDRREGKPATACRHANRNMMEAYAKGWRSAGPPPEPGTRDSADDLLDPLEASFVPGDLASDHRIEALGRTFGLTYARKLHAHLGAAIAEFQQAMDGMTVAALHAAVNEAEE